MKILLVSGSNSRNSGGLYNSVRNLGQSMMKIKGLEPTLLTHSDEYSALDIAAYEPLPVENYDVSGPSGFAFSSNIAKKITAIKPDIIHPQCIWMYLSFATFQFSKKHNTPYIISARGMLDKWILNNNAWKKKLIGGLYEKDYLNNAACLNALALPEYEAMRDFGCKNPIAVIPNGVNLPAEEWPLDATIPQWKSNDDRKVMLFLSRLHPKKGIENLLKAWANLGPHKQQWKLAIAGEAKDPGYLQDLLSLSAALKLEKDVFFIGPQFHKEKDVCFRCVDAFILPSFSEGLPMAVLEAWSYQLPIVMTAACNIPEGFEKEAALKVSTEIDSINEGIKKLFDLTDEERGIIGKNGLQLVKDKFIWSSIAKQMNDVYQWILFGGEQPVSIIDK